MQTSFDALKRQLFPEGSTAVKIEWIKKKSPVSSYFVEVPEVLKSVSFIGHQKIPEHVRVGFCPI